MFPRGRLPVGARTAGDKAMIRTSQEYLDSIRDSREVYINGERVKDVTEIRC